MGTEGHVWERSDLFCRFCRYRIAFGFSYANGAPSYCEPDPDSYPHRIECPRCGRPHVCRVEACYDQGSFTEFSISLMPAAGPPSKKYAIRARTKPKGTDQ